MQLVEQHVIQKKDVRFAAIDAAAFAAKNLYNAALSEVSMGSYPLHVDIASSERRFPIVLIALFALLVLSACSSNGGVANSITPVSTKSNAPQKQMLTFPNVGVTDVSSLDPASGLDENANLVASMIYSGLVRSDQHLQPIPDQASWQVSPDNKTYTFTLKTGLTFSDGTPLNAQSYIYTWTRALLPEVSSPVALLFEGPIVGANDVSNGKAQTISGLKAINDQTLQVTLSRPTPYFLAELTNSIFFPLNQQVLDNYGSQEWDQHVAGKGVGSGPFMVKEWQHNVKMELVPNPHYYGNKTRLTTVDMRFINDPTVAFKASRAGQYDFIWGIDPTDQESVKSTAGFTRASLLETDTVFFDTTRPPFDNIAMRQAFAYALDKPTLAHTVLHDTVLPASTILPPGMPGYQDKNAGLSYEPVKALNLLHTVYPDITKIPPLTFSYPIADVPGAEVSALQQMWQRTLGIQIVLRPVEENAYYQELKNHQVTFGFNAWTADFADPYDGLALNLASFASGNVGQWHNDTFDQLIMQAETTTGDARLALYDSAEQVALSDVAWLPLTHDTLAALIPGWVHGVSLNGQGLYFGDWSGVYLTHH